MQNCLPSFFLIGSSMPVALQSDIADPGYRGMAENQRRASRVAPKPVHEQPSRMARPVPQYRRFSAYEKRRAEAPLAGPGHAQKTFAQLRKTKSAPTSPEVHNSWVGIKENGRQWEERRGSNPIWPSDPMLIIAAPSEENEKHRRQSMQSLHSLPPRFVGSGSRASGPPRATGSSPSSIASDWTPATLSAESFVSPVMHQEHDGRDSPPIPFPPLEPLFEQPEYDSGDITTAHDESPYSAFHIMVGTEAPPPPSTPLTGSRSRATTRARSQTVRSRADTDASSLPRSATSSPRPKRVSFSPELDEVIHFRAEPEHEEEPPMRPAPLFSSFLPISGMGIAISRPPVAASSPLKRQSSLPSIRGHAAQAPVGRGILKRSNTVDALVPPEEPNPSRVSFDGWDSPVPSSASSSPSLSDSRPSSVSSNGSTSSSYSAYSAASSASSFSYEEATIETGAVQMTKGRAEQVVISPTSRSKKPIPEEEFGDLGVKSPEIGSKSPRHWSMAGVGVWVAKDGSFEYSEYSETEHDEFPFPQQEKHMKQGRQYNRAPSPLAERQYNRAPSPLSERQYASAPRPMMEKQYTRTPPPLPPRVTALRA